MKELRFAQIPGIVNRRLGDSIYCSNLFMFHGMFSFTFWKLDKNPYNRPKRETEVRS